MYLGFYDPEKNRILGYKNLDITREEVVVSVMGMRLLRDKGEIRLVTDFPVVSGPWLVGRALIDPEGTWSRSWVVRTFVYHRDFLPIVRLGTLIVIPPGYSGIPVPVEATIRGFCDRAFG